jgi:invasion protein IalB
LSRWEPRVDVDDDRLPPARRRQQGGGGAISVLIGVIVLLAVAGGGLAYYIFAASKPGAEATTATAGNGTQLRPTADQAPAAPQNTVQAPAIQPPAAQAAAQQSAGGQASAGQTAAAQPAPKMVVSKQQAYGDWIYACVARENSDAAPVCTISQTLSEPSTKKPLFIWRIQRGQSGLVAEWQTRTGVMIDRGIVISGGSDKPITVPYQMCTPTGCQAVANLAPDFVENLKKADKPTVTVYPIGMKGIILALSSKGLGDALVALQTP